MRQLKTSALPILAAIICLSILSAFRATNNSAASTSVDSTDSVANTKSAALAILQTRCNTCHVRQNPSKVFTSANMSILAPKMNEQVFIKKRMPRGKRLTAVEYTTLQNWLNTQNIK